MKRFSPILLVLFISFGVHAQNEAKWTIEHAMKFKAITDTEVSPNGDYVAYVVREPVMDGEKSEYNQQIWVAAIDGSMDVQYTRGEKSSWSPKFSPDGSAIAFLSSRSDKTQIWRMRLMGGEPIQISSAKEGVNSFQWSPDGTKIAYIMRDPLTEDEEKDKKEKKDVILVDQNYKYNHLYTLETTANEEDEYQSRQITAGQFSINGYDWAPDGSSIVFSHAPTPTINENFIESDISIVPSDSGAVTSIVSRPGADRNPKFSPDGKWIAFQSHGGSPEPIGLSDIYKVETSGGSPQKLQETPDRNANIIDWSADGSHLFITETYKTSPVLMAVPTNASAQKLSGDQLSYSESGIPILASLDGASYSFSINSKVNRMSFIYETPDQPEEVYTSQLTSGGQKKLSAVNEKVKIPQMGKTELVSWKSSHDGTTIEGLLTYPVEYEKGKKYPVILQIHGGPAGVFTKSYTGGPSIYVTQYFSQQGYIIIRPNPRGSQGYGKDFRYANFKDWGFGDYEDCISGVDHVIKMGIADKNRQYVMGWSYGGYMTSFVVTRTDRFKAASMGAGLPNLVSMVTTTDIPDYLVGHLGSEFWEDYEEYEKHSAIYRIKNVKTPTQVIHGANDLRVPFTQGQEFYVALKRLGVDTEMVVYPRTPHGPREPKLLMDVSPRILEWFEKFQ